MSKVKFTEEQQQELRNNKYTAKVTANSLSFTKEFKELFHNEYLTGVLPREILRRYGYPVEILGKQRIWGIAHCIKKEYESNGSFRDVRSPRLSFSTLFDADFVELNEKNFCLYLMVCCLYLEVKASLKRLKALTSKYRQHEK